MKLEQEKQFTVTSNGLANILQHYDLELQTYVAATSGIENTTLIVTTNTNKVVIRIYRLDKKPLDEIVLELDFMRYLYDAGIKVPYIHSNKHNSLVTDYEHNGKTWQVVAMEYITGTHAQEYTAQLLFDMAHAQAQMHVLSSSYSTSVDLPIIGTALKEEYFLHLIDQSTIKEDGIRDFLYRAANFTVTIDASLPAGLCHLDYDKDNIIVDNNTIAAILDFDDLARAPFTVCLGYTLWHVWRYGGKQMARTYLAEYEKVRALDANERRWLGEFILFRHYMISDLKILNGHISKDDATSYTMLESEILQF